MIEKISVTNFKSHADTKIELGRVTALIGPNGCGKTGLLQAIYSISSLSNKVTSEVFGDENHPDILVRGNGKSFSIEASCDVFLPTWKLRIEAITGEKYVGKTRNWGLKFRGHSQDSSLGQQELGITPHISLSQFIPKELIQELGPAEYFKASPTKLAQPSFLENFPPILLPDGSGLPSVIADFILSEPNRYKIIEEELCGIVPTVRKIRIRHTQIQQVENVYFSERGIPTSYQHNSSQPGYELIFDTLSADTVPAYAMSEGTLLVLGMLTRLYSPYPPILFLIDDAEQGLHPLAQRKMMSIFKRFAESQNCQIVLTSHSPYIIDELEAKDVWVMATDKEGTSHCKRLSDHHDAKRLLEVLTTGEFGGAVGEDWVIPNESLAEVVNA